MFGYLRPYKPEMKMKEFAAFKAVYCGLCRTLGKRYGFLARMILSYDATVMSVLCLSLSSLDCSYGKCRCPANPMRVCSITDKSSVTDYFADASVILSYYKIKDDIKDKGFLKKIAGAVLLPFASLFYRKAARNAVETDNLVKTYISSQSLFESKHCSSIDAAADPTAKLMSAFLVNFAHNNREQRILERMGYFIGRWIYYCDAAEDRLKDKKRGDYNPFNEVKTATDAEIATLEEQLLNSCIYEINAALSLLEIKRYNEIISNIFSLGLPEVKKAVLSGLDKKEKREKFSAVYKL